MALHCHPGLPPTGAQMGIDLLSGGSFYADPHGRVLDDVVPVTNPNTFIFRKADRGKSATEGAAAADDGLRLPRTHPRRSEG